MLLGVPSRQEAKNAFRTTHFGEHKSSTDTLPIHLLRLGGATETIMLSLHHELRTPLLGRWDNLDEV